MLVREYVEHLRPLDATSQTFQTNYYINFAN